MRCRGSKVIEIDGQKRSSLLVGPPDGKLPRLKVTERFTRTGPDSPLYRARRR